MAKAAAARIEETINFIRDNRAYAILQRTSVARFCRENYQSLEPDQVARLSNAMSVSAHAVRPAGTETQRAGRRAIMLIWRSMYRRVGEVPAEAAAAMTIPAADVDASLGDAILKAAVMAHQVSAGDVFYRVFSHDPVNFLQTHKIQTIGAGEEGAWWYLFQFDTRTRKFVFTPHGRRDRGAAEPEPGGAGGCVFPAIHVRGTPWYNVPGNGGELGPHPIVGDFTRINGLELVGANYMVQTQFSGCTFCWTNIGAVVRAAHIMPTKPTHDGVPGSSYSGGDLALASRMAERSDPLAGMANAPGAVLNVFGSGAGYVPRVAGGRQFYPPDSRACIVGIQAAGWRFYVQVLNAGIIDRGKHSSDRSGLNRKKLGLPPYLCFRP